MVLGFGCQVSGSFDLIPDTQNEIPANFLSLEKTSNNLMLKTSLFYKYNLFLHPNLKK